ncbi:glycine-rich domain-containing protein 2 [Musa acuminata AAA Group]|uniref:GRPD C-terminal domain-containing protein n=2 Tax=Musa acuminata subsp. malaccensis TaxID=214687 RepID=A0A804JIW3_MUSAM|nr:PREDICTED: glycine-rich domain-containing protein 2 [Musa acuminata subsp. malaccensis]
MSGNNITRVASDDGSFATRSLHESSSRCDSGHGGATRLSVDLVTAARRHVSFLRSFATSPVLHHAPTVARAIRRYDQLWMPLIAELAQAAPPSAPPMLLPPPDVHWVWYCHCLDPAGSYREYCTLRFGALVDRPLIIDDENEEYAYNRCREVWAVRYPSEPFDLEVDSAEDGEASGKCEDHLSAVVARYRTLYSFFCDPFVSETVYLVAARRRYSSFLHLSRRSIEDGMLRMVVTSDIFLIWLTHQSYPRSYAKDIEDRGDPARVTVCFGDRATAEEAKETVRAWEEALDEPYERAGAVLDPAASPSRVYFNWETAEADVNRSYKGLQPRFLLEVRIFLKGKWEEREDKHLTKNFLRLRTIRCNREMKLNEPVHDLSSETWHKTWHLYCEFGTRGIVIEVRRRGSNCLINSKLITKLVFLWNDLLRATTLMLKKELEMQVRALASITPPVQAPYLLKCVPDRVTDDGGAMISDVVLRMNRYHPQQGRWLSRTVLDHAKRECFVIRIRVGRGIWRRGAESPVAVKWEDRIIEVREGPWLYVAGTVGVAPDKIAGTATPKKEDSQVKKMLWCLSTGDVLTIQWENGLDIQLENGSSGEQAKLLTGRKLQYQLKDVGSSNEEEEQYLTLVRFTSEHPDGKATALLNWKLLAVEFLPEEDAVLVLLVCVAVARTISEIRREDMSGLLARRRVREFAGGCRDWGSVLLPSSSTYSSVHLQPWYWNAHQVLASAETSDSGLPISKHLPADGKCSMYEQVILS